MNIYPVNLSARFIDGYEARAFSEPFRSLHTLSRGGLTNESRHCRITINPFMQLQRYLTLSMTGDVDIDILQATGNKIEIVNDSNDPTISRLSEFLRK